MLRSMAPLRIGHHGSPLALATLSENPEDNYNYNYHMMKDLDNSSIDSTTPMATSIDDHTSSEYSYSGSNLDEMKGARDVAHTLHAVSRHGSSHRRRGSAVDALMTPEPPEPFEVHLPKGHFKHRRFSLGQCYNQFIEHSLNPKVVTNIPQNTNDKYLVMGISPPTGVSGTFKETIADLTSKEPEHLGSSVNQSALTLQKYIETFDQTQKDDDSSSSSDRGEYGSRFPTITSPVQVPRRKSSRLSAESRLLSRSHSPPLSRDQRHSADHAEQISRERSFSHGARNQLRRHSLLPRIETDGQKPSGTEKKKNFIAENKKKLAEVSAKNRRKSVEMIDASQLPLGSAEKLHSTSRRPRGDDERLSPRAGTFSQKRFSSVGLTRADEANRPPSRDGQRPRAKSFSHFIERTRKLKITDEDQSSSSSSSGSFGGDQDEESRPRSSSFSSANHSVRFGEAVQEEAAEHHEPLPLALYPKHSILKVKEHHYNDEMAPVCYFVTHQEDFKDEDESMFSNVYTERSVKKAAAKFTSLLKGRLSKPPALAKKAGVNFAASAASSEATVATSGGQ